jgi:hypothetical protein
MATIDPELLKDLCFEWNPSNHGSWALDPERYLKAMRESKPTRPNNGQVLHDTTRDRWYKWDGNKWVKKPLETDKFVRALFLEFLKRS